jgi:hypothetical protein
MTMMMLVLGGNGRPLTVSVVPSVATPWLPSSHPLAPPWNTTRVQCSSGVRSRGSCSESLSAISWLRQQSVAAALTVRVCATCTVTNERPNRLTAAAHELWWGVEVARLQCCTTSGVTVPSFRTGSCGFVWRDAQCVAGVRRVSGGISDSESVRFCEHVPKPVLLQHACIDALTSEGCGQGALSASHSPSYEVSCWAMQGFDARTSG